MKSPHVIVLSCLLLAALPMAWGADALSVVPVRSVSFEGVSHWVALGPGGWAQAEQSRVQFIGADSSVRATINLEGKEVLVSEAGASVIGVLVYADQQPSLLRVKQFSLYDDQGRRRLSLNDPIFNNAVVAPGGNAFVGLKGAEDFPRQELLFYDGSGQLLGSDSVTNFAGGRFCADGSRFLFETGGAGLQVATADGQLAHVIGPVETWGCSADGRLVGVAWRGRLRFIRDGKPIGSVTWPDPDERIRAIAVADDGLRAAAVSAGYLAAIRLDSISILWTKTPDTSSWNFRSVDLLPGLSALAVGLDYDPVGQDPTRHQKSRCWVLDGDGTALSTLESTPTTWGARFPQVRFLDGGRRLLFADRDRAQWATLNGR
ncbi:MAG: hypothetical protein AB1792_06535 [Candidatus Zixiibacteriota bacterium]